MTGEGGGMEVAASVTAEAVRWSAWLGDVRAALITIVFLLCAILAILIVESYRRR